MGVEGEAGPHAMVVLSTGDLLLSLFLKTDTGNDILICDEGVSPLSAACVVTLCPLSLLPVCPLSLLPVWSPCQQTIHSCVFLE